MKIAELTVRAVNRALYSLRRAICCLTDRVVILENGGGGGGGIQSVVAGTNVTVDDSDPLNPIVSSSGGGAISRFGVEDNIFTADRVVDFNSKDLLFNMPEFTNFALIDTSYSSVVNYLRPGGMLITDLLGYRYGDYNNQLMRVSEVISGRSRGITVDSLEITFDQDNVDTKTTKLGTRPLANPLTERNLYLPDANGTLVVSVNGVASDVNGNVTLPAGGSSSSYIEVEIGTPEATALGLIDTATVYTNPAMANRQVEVQRNALNIPSFNWASSTHFIKVLADNFLTFSDPLHNGELIKVKIL